MENTNIELKLKNETNKMFYCSAGVFECLCHNKSILENPERRQLEASFQSDGYPKIGDIPILNRKMFKADRVSIREHPYVVSIRRKYAHYATGALLMKNLVISVAHPFHRVPISELGVVYGQTYADRGPRIMTVLLLIIHEHFDPYTLTGDIALLRLYEDIEFKASIKSISLVSPTTKLEGFKAFVTGWGRCDRTGSELCLSRSSIYFPDEKLDPMLTSVTFTVPVTNSYCDAYKRVSDLHIVPNCSLETGFIVEEVKVTLNLKLLQSSKYFSLFLEPTSGACIAVFERWILINISILEKISSSDLTLFFVATKSYVFIKWLENARNRKPLDMKLQTFQTELQELDVDILLSKMNGTIYDIRDFIDHGKYGESKKNMYKSIKTTHNKMKKIEALKITTDVAVPFINNETLNENGLYLSNGLLENNNVNI